MRDVRTDLAMECMCGDPSELKGVDISSKQMEQIKLTSIRIHSDQAAVELGKPQGRYVTLEYDELPKCDADTQEQIVQLIADTLQSMLPDEGDVLVVGLGNRNVTADALGTRVVERMLVTRHIRESLAESVIGRLRGVSAIAPGVLGLTGIETAELCRGLVQHVQPSVVVAIDALAACDSNRICTTIQITDTGIDPGSGVGNHRLGLNEETLNVKVIAIGVPMVVYASTIAHDAMAQLIADYHIMPEQQQSAADLLLKQVGARLMGDMVVTPREIDELVLNVADILALGINQALHPSLNPLELHTYMRP